MKLQTQVPLKMADNQIGYQSNLFLLGSCFVEHIGAKLQYHKFRTNQNPFGILFHPIAIENLLSRAIEERRYTQNEVFELDERWHSFDAHSDLSDVSKEKLVGKLNQGLENTKQHISAATHIVITLGTAWVYNHVDSGQFVANCHKVPQKQFQKELLSVKKVIKSLRRVLELIRRVNEKAEITFTVSPVRHLKDGFVENQQSKAHLISAIGKLLASKEVSEKEHYFPSYEIMMDELRDYRFYKSDMVHPNEIAVGYIWEKFIESWISKEAFPIMEKVQEIQRGLGHISFNPNSSEHQKFLTSLSTKIQTLQLGFPHIEF